MTQFPSQKRKNKAKILRFLQEQHGVGVQCTKIASRAVINAKTCYTVLNDLKLAGVIGQFSKKKEKGMRGAPRVYYFLKDTAKADKLIEEYENDLRCNSVSNL